MTLPLRCLCSVLLLVVVAALANGCKSTEPENVSTRPWNSPRGSDSSLPGIYTPNR